MPFSIFVMSAIGNKKIMGTLLKGDEPRAQGRRTGSSEVTNWQLDDYKVPLYDSKYRTNFSKYAILHS